MEVPLMDSSTAGWHRGFDMRAFINRVADHFQDSADILVDPSGREALLQPALPHLENVARELATGGLTIDFLEKCVLSVLGKAPRIAGELGCRRSTRRA